MTEMTASPPLAIAHDAAARRVSRRNAAERRFRLYGLGAIVTAIALLAVLLYSVLAGGLPAFWQATVGVEVYFDPDEIDPQGNRDPEVLRTADYQRLLKDGLRDFFPEVTKRKERRLLYKLISSAAGYELGQQVLADPEMIGTTQLVWVAASDTVSSLVKGGLARDPASESGIRHEKLLGFIEALESRDRVTLRFNANFFTSGDSREPEQAGIWGAVVGSFFTLLITLFASFPVAVLAAVYLEEFAPKNRFTDLIEVNINNLAAVPSIIFGLLGLAIFLNFFGLPRSAPLVGGLVLSLMTLPTIIIAARAALKAVPPSIRQAALAIGASPLQTTLHHTLPLAMPGILTGTIIGMAGALGETAPLLMIGMVAFIVDIPGGVTDAATVLPVQIYIWSDSPERGFSEKTNAAIIVLLAFLIFMNGLAVVLRKKFEHRW